MDYIQEITDEIHTSNARVAYLEQNNGSKHSIEYLLERIEILITQFANFCCTSWNIDESARSIDENGINISEIDEIPFYR